MSTRRAATSKETDTIEVVTETLTEAEQDALSIEENIAALFDASDETVTWNCMVYEIDKSQGNAELYLFSVLPDELPALNDRLRDNHGTGTYRVRVYRKEGNKNRVFRQFDRRIKAAPKPISAPAQQTDLAAVLATMERNTERMIQAISASQQRQQVYTPPAPVDPFSTMTQMATAMGAMMQAFRPAEGASSMDLILKGVELATSLEKSDKETGLLDIVKEALGSLPALVQITEAQRVAATPPGTAVTLPGKQPPPSNPVKPAPVQTQVSPEQQAQMQIRQMILSLIPNAAKGSDPGLYADWLADQWGMEMVAAVVTQPNILMQLQSLVPEMTQYSAWFQSLLEELGSLVEDARAKAHGSGDASGKHSPAVNSVINTGWRGGSESDAEDYE